MWKRYVLFCDQDHKTPDISVLILFLTPADVRKKMSVENSTDIKYKNPSLTYQLSHSLNLAVNFKLTKTEDTSLSLFAFGTCLLQHPE